MTFGIPWVELTNPYLRALLGDIILFPARAQMIAVAGDSKGFSVFMLFIPTQKGMTFGHPLLCWCG